MHLATMTILVHITILWVINVLERLLVICLRINVYIATCMDLTLGLSRITDNRLSLIILVAILQRFICMQVSLWLPIKLSSRVHFLYISLDILAI